VTKNRRRRLYYAQCRVPALFRLVSWFCKPYSTAAVDEHLTGGELLDWSTILTRSTARVADDVALAHLSVAVARLGYSTKGISLIS
jgi:hypothetical protein